jgi:hypothetical protein
MLFFPPRWGPHADRRKRKYGINEQQIAFTWLYGEIHPERDQCWRLIGEELTLILDPLQLFIMTLFPNRSKDSHIARNARIRRANGNIRNEWLNGSYNLSNTMSHDEKYATLLHIWMRDCKLATISHVRRQCGTH